MNSFSKAMKQYQYPEVIDDIDMYFYRSRLRTIHRVFRKASPALETLIINFAHNPILGIPSHPDKDFEFTRTEMRRALRKLIETGYVEQYKRYYYNPNGQGRCTLYNRTKLFESTFKFKVKGRIRVNKESLSLFSIDYLKDCIRDATSAYHSIYWADMSVKSGTTLKNYQKLIQGTKLSLGTANQVFEDICLVSHGARLYQKGKHNYQSLPKDERKHLRINGHQTIELDYKNLHPNLLLNMMGLPCDNRFYENILYDLGLRLCKSKRKALKLIVLIALNISSKASFTRYIKYHYRDKKGNLVINSLGITPPLIYKSINKLYPALQPFICNGKNALMLQTIDSKIMLNVLDTLAGKGVIALPVHDSIIVPIDHKDLAHKVMVDCYQQRMGFPIKVD